MAVLGRNLGRLASDDAALVEALAAGELLEALLAELEHCRVIDPNHIDGFPAIVLELPARAALGREVDYVDEQISFSGARPRKTKKARTSTGDLAVEGRGGEVAKRVEL